MKTAMTLLSLRNLTFRRVLAFACLAIFLGLQVLAASGPLHKTIHPDAGTPRHQCVITMLVHGQVSASSSSPALIIFAAALFGLAASLRHAFVSSFAYRLSPSRAPPRL